MKQNWEKFYKIILSIFFYGFIFFLPWQTKLIIRPAADNFNEVSFFASHILLALAFLVFVAYKSRFRDDNGRVAEIWYFLTGLSFFVFLSFFFAPDKVLAFYRYIIFLLGLGLFYMLREGFDARPYVEQIIDKGKVVIVFLSSIFLHIILGIYQFLFQNTFACKYFGLASHDPYAAGSSVIMTESGRWLRAYGGFDHPNIFGGVLAVSLILAAYMLAKKKHIDSAKDIAESIFLFIFYFFGLLAMLFAFSRTSWLALVIALSILLLVFAIKKDRWATGRLIAVAFFSLILSTVIFFSFRELFNTRIKAEAPLERISIEERQSQIFESKEILKDNWLFGTGIGNYTAALSEKKLAEQKTAANSQPVHNAFLLLWAEGGIFVLVFFLSFFISLFARRGREDFAWSLLIALSILMIFDHWLLSLPFGTLFLFFVFGML